MRSHKVRHSTQTDANREFAGSARTELQFSILALVVFTIIAFLSLQR